METELAWAAGFFDGEGCTIIHTKNPSIVVYVSQKEPTTLERFVSAVRVGKVYFSKNYGMWQVSLTSKTAIVALGRLWPYLSQPKRTQALVALDRLTERLDGRPLPTQPQK